MSINNKKEKSLGRALERAKDLYEKAEYRWSITGCPYALSHATRDMQYAWKTIIRIKAEIKRKGRT